MKKRRELAFAISAITQLGFKIVFSFLIWIFIAKWIKNTFELGNYVVVIGIVLGIGSACVAFYDFYKKAGNISEKEDPDEN